MIRHFLAAFLILCFARAMCAQSAAQAGPPSSRIAAITVTGTHKFPAEQVIAASKLKLGETVSAQQIQAAADLLSALGVFSAVNYRFSPRGDGAIALEFQVQEAPLVPLSFDNFPWFTDDEIAQAIRADVGLFNGESPESGTLLDEIDAVIEKLLSSKNIQGMVKHEPIASPDGNGMIMQFRVEGPALRIQSVLFSDPLAAESEKLKDRVPDLRGQPYSRYAIAVFESEQVSPLYASAGYLRAQISPAQPHFADRPDTSGEFGIDVSISIVPGPVYTWSGVSWQGNSNIPSGALDGLVGMKPGDIADAMKIEAAWQRIETEYGHHGYLDAKLTPQAQFDDDAHRVSYRVGIGEGAQYRMGVMIVTGLSLDAEKLLLRAWQLSAGQIFDNAYFEALLPVLAKPSPDIFGNLPVHYTQFGHLLRPNTELHTVDVLLDFK